MPASVTVDEVTNDLASVMEKARSAGSATIFEGSRPIAVLVPVEQLGEAEPPVVASEVEEARERSFEELASDFMDQYDRAFWGMER